jgi:hypothetical protein
MEHNRRSLTPKIAESQDLASYIDPPEPRLTYDFDRVNACTEQSLNYAKAIDKITQ